MKKNTNQIVYRVLLSLVSLALSSNTFANGIWVSGQTRTTIQQGAGNQFTTGTFKTTYQNTNLPWGARLFIVYGYNCSAGSWIQQGENELYAVSDYTWQANFSSQIGSRYIGSCTQLQFAFKIIYPSGSVSYDNGGVAPMGFYSSEIPPHDHTETQYSVRAVSN